MKLLFFLSAGLPLTAFAQEIIPDLFKDAESPQPLLDIVETIGNWIFTLLLALAVIFVILAAFNYLTSGGSDEKVKKAHMMLLYAVIGVAVGLLAQGIVFVIQKIVGVSI